VEDAGSEYYGLGFDAFHSEEEQGADQTWDTSAETHPPGPAGLDEGQNQRLSGAFGNVELDFEAFNPEKEFGADQTWESSHAGYQLPSAGFDGEPSLHHGNPAPYSWELGVTVDKNPPAHISAWEWGGDPMELEIPKEAVYASTEVTPNSNIPSSTSTTENTTLASGSTRQVRSDEGTAAAKSNNSRSSYDPSSQSTGMANTDPVPEWFCDVTNCGRSFTHLWKLKYALNAPRTPCPPTNNTMKSPQEISHQTLSLL
jgi:hypothetical protein